MLAEKTGLVMMFGNPDGDPRPNRMIGTLTQRRFLVDIVSHQVGPKINHRQHWVIPSGFGSKVIRRLFYLIRCILAVIPLHNSIKNLINNFAFRLTGLSSQLSHNYYDFIVVEDLFMLPLAFKIKGRAVIIFDAREYYPRENEENFLWRVFERPERIRLCSEYLHLCDHTLTVSPGLQREYKKDFGVEALLFRSVPRYTNQMPRSVERENIKLVHHGIANPDRKLSDMIDVLRVLDSRFSLDMYLTGSKNEIDFLKAYAADCSRVKIKDPVRFDDLNELLSNYDIGFYYTRPSSFNLLHCLPNKFFEFIQARLAVAIGPSPDMASLVREYDCGVVASSFSISEMAAAINSLTVEDIWRYKTNACRAARVLNHETEVHKLAGVLW